MSRDVTRITNSSLKFTQAVDAIKRFVIPKIDYELFASAAPTNELNRLDATIRGKLSKSIKAAGIPIEWFYTPQKDGGLNLQLLTERQKALTIRLYVGLLGSKDKRVRDIIHASDEAEINYRGIDVDRTSPYLKVPVDEHGYMSASTNRHTSNLLSRCVKALHGLDLGLRCIEDNFTLTDLESPIEHDIHTVNVDVDRNNVMKQIMNILKQRHFANLCKHNMKGHSFPTLADSPLSSFF